MSSTTAYFFANRIWWSAALVAGPIAAALAGKLIVGVALIGLLLLPAFFLFDTDRPWWPAEVRRLPHDPARTRSEIRKLTLTSGTALVVGLAIALIRPWA